MHNALAENEGFCNTNSIEKTDTKSKPTTIREQFFLVVLFLELIRYTYFNQKGQSPFQLTLRKPLSAIV